MVSSIYDPVGFLSPILAIKIRLKILLQELHERKISWDKPLDVTSKSAWFKLVGELEKDEQMVFPRCFVVGVEEEQYVLFATRVLRRLRQSVYRSNLSKDEDITWCIRNVHNVEIESVSPGKTVDSTLRTIVRARTRPAYR